MEDHVVFLAEEDHFGLPRPQPTQQRAGTFHSAKTASDDYNPRRTHDFKNLVYLIAP